MGTGRVVSRAFGVVLPVLLGLRLASFGSREPSFFKTVTLHAVRQCGAEVICIVNGDARCGRL